VLADIPADAMYEEFARIAPALTDGLLSMAAGYDRILRACSAEPQPEWVRPAGVQRRAAARVGPAPVDDSARRCPGPVL